MLPTTPMVFRPAFAAWLLSAALVLGCSAKPSELETGFAETQSGLDALQRRIEGLEQQLEASQQSLSQLEAADVNRTEYLDTRLATISERLASLPGEIDVSCPATEPVTAECEVTERVVVTADKMLVGELEYVWIEPPGVNVVARIDTGATSSSVHASNVVKFERDGEDWARFDMALAGDEYVTLERQIVRYARVVQQADPTGSRRPVVEIRVRLGDVQETFEFTLADRAHLENQLILGRNFLTDVSLVDVSRQFVQPRHSPPKSQ